MHNFWEAINSNSKPLKTIWFLRNKPLRMFLITCWKKFRRKSSVTCSIRKSWKSLLLHQKKFHLKEIQQFVTCAGRIYGSKWYLPIDLQYRQSFQQLSKTGLIVIGESIVEQWTIMGTMPESIITYFTKRGSLDFYILTFFDVFSLQVINSKWKARQ